MMYDATAVVGPARQQAPDEPLPREVEELALLYGVEAHRHLGDVEWDAVRDELAAGWPRIRRQRDVEWRHVARCVAAGWQCPTTSSK